MPYLIDGHNLIPKVPGLSLHAIDDELQLLEMLQDFCQRQNRQAEVYFDRAPAGQAGTRGFGRVKAHFVRQGGTADDAIRARLDSLRRTAPNWTVVSSDAAVQSAARMRGAQVLSSEAFAGQLVAGGSGASSRKSKKQSKKPEQDISPGEVEEWMKYFGGDDDE